MDIRQAACLYAANMKQPYDFTLSVSPFTKDGKNKTYSKISYHMRSIGPGHQFADHAIYDPTNGTVSLGELIWVSTAGPLWNP